MRTIENFALVPSTQEESIKKISKEQISKIMDDVFAENNQINNIIKNLGKRINTFPQLGFNYLLVTIPLNVKVSPNVSNINQTAFGNFLEIGRMSNINGKFIGKFNFFYFNGESDVDVKLNANIKNKSLEFPGFDEANMFDYDYLFKKITDKKLGIIAYSDINVKGNLNIDVPRTFDVLFLSNIVTTPKAMTETETSSIRENIINVSSPLLIIMHNCNINFNIKYWAPKYENTECPKLECPKIVCPKFECPKVECPTLECPKVDCPKVECPKVECPKVECSNYDKIYIGVIISLLLAMFILTYLYLTKKETN